jgi:phosphoribosylamine--glycine ligase
MEKRGVEATVIGKFTKSGNCVVKYGNKTVLDIEMDFLHNGRPIKHQHTRSQPIYRLNKQPINGLTTLQKPLVIKASGLALGKGVAVCKTLDEAKKFLRDVMVNKIFGGSGSQVVIEEFLQGQEFSIHAFCDGKNFQLLPSSQDHKPIYDGGLGPNTGGMGTIAPVPWVSELMMNEVSSRIVKPALEGLKNLDSPFVGLLYPGLMLTSPNLSSEEERNGPSSPPFKGGARGGYIKVIEFNARFGDPETQSYMRLLKTDLLDILEACVDGKIADIKIEWSKKSACCIVLASGGYPGKYEKGKIITGIEQAEKMDGIAIFHAGTILLDSNIVTNGGRVLGVTAVADNLQTALNKAYAAVKLIHFDGMQYRTDIGMKSLLNTKGG